MRLFVARHGQTLWNAQNRVCGRTDIPLTEKGIEQAEALADKARGLDLDLIISSPLLRARMTSAAVSRACGVSIAIDERLIEQDYGIYEGVDRKDPRFLENKKHFAYPYPGGESMMQVAHRVYGMLEEIKQKHGNKNVLLICHGGVCRIIHTYFESMTNAEFFHYSPSNADIREYKL